MFENYEQMDLVALIDSESFFIVDIDRNNLKPDDFFVKDRPPQGLYCAKWTGSEWIETMTEAEYIATLPKPPEREPTLEERNRADIDYLSIMAGVSLDV